MSITTYQEALDWLYSYVRFDKRRRKPGSGDLTRMARLLERLGAPQKHFPSVLIAGTKGKGSTAAMLASILRASGYRTGLYTSPHLHTFRERIRVDEQLITREEIIAGARRLEAVAPDFPDLIWFELVTALAFEFFATHEIDIAVLEVGLGGRLDPTNVVQPRVSVIMPISYDHVEVLGSTLTAIATEKAGIIKEGTPVVSAPQEDEARTVIEATAQARHAPLVLVQKEWSWERIESSLDGQSFRVRGPNQTADEFFIPLLGRHQLANATTTLAVVAELQRQGWRLEKENIHRGLARVEWPVRLEILAREPVILADGAHNRASAHVLRAALDDLFPEAHIYLVFGASNDKDIAGMFQELLAGRRMASVILTHSQHVRATDPEVLEQLATPYQTPLTETQDVASALRLARERAAREDVICVTGSLFVAAEARAWIRKEQGLPVPSDDTV